jgi:Zn-dependent M28 family amino/carboxypeptidase
MSKKYTTAVSALALSGAFLAGPAMAQGVDSSALREAVTVSAIREHQAKLDEIAAANGGNRAAGTSGYQASLYYVVRQLARAGYEVTVQPFQFNLFSETTPPKLRQLSPDATTYEPTTDFLTMEYSGSGDVSALLEATNDVIIPPLPQPGSTSGCEPADFNASVNGKIALIQRGTCTFLLKAQNAEAAGAVGAIIFNEGQEGRTEVLSGTLSESVGIPVVGISFDLGAELYDAVQDGNVRMRLAVESTVTTTQTYNVLADSAGGTGSRTVVVGAHLDSVADGAGINDNGSGSAVILEIAKQIAKLGIQPANRLRFAFWGAEESGLIGSTYYVGQLSQAQADRTLANLNFDMLGSPNFVNFVYDGNGSDTPAAGPHGSGLIERVFINYLEGQGFATVPTAFDGRSDYGPFIAVGIPAGGLFSGAEGIKTNREARIFGGTAGEAYDPCYHQACDTIANHSNRALNQLGDAAAHAVLYFAMTDKDVRGVEARSASAAAYDFDYLGSHLRR